MQRLSCPSCGARAYFHNLVCVCGLPLHYDPETRAMVNAAASCGNRDSIGCNWVADGDGHLCRSCAMSRVVPALHVGDNLSLLAGAEHAKRWVLVNLSRWDWFTDADPGMRPVFLMLSEKTQGRTERIVMGHASGQITINVTEADELIRLQRQRQLGEQYRSMVGHFRHELAHFCFDRLALAPGFLPAFRALFGDERADYATALQAHYANPRDPGEQFITSYATAHPHEDWAETFAHLLHLVDFSDSFVNCGLSMPGLPTDLDPYRETDSARLLTAATEIAIAINSINRALDNDDLYPFVLTGPVREKMAFAHGWMRDHIGREDQPALSSSVSHSSSAASSAV